MVDLVIMLPASGAGLMTNRDEYDELEKIIRAQKPGFTIDRRALPKRPRSETDVPSEPTPDTDELRAKAEEILEGKVGARRGQARGAGQSISADPVDTDDDIRIVNIRPEHPDDSPDQFGEPRKVIISRSKGRIVGEQG
jgi:hypothetical protein